MRQQNQVFQVNKQTNTDIQFDRKLKKSSSQKKFTGHISHFPIEIL